MTGSGGDYDFAYDARGNLLSENVQISGHSSPISYAYNQSGQVISITYPGGRTVDYPYDITGNITNVSTTLSGSTTTVADNISYLPHGPLQHLEYGNAIFHDAVFDQQYRMTDQTTGSVLNRSYTLNALGNVSAITDNLDFGKSQDFSYDTLDKLNWETGSYGSITYSHDKTGNRLSTTVSGITTAYSYEAGTNMLTKVGGDSLSHDPAGMITSSDNGRYRYSYNDGRGLESLSEKNGKMFFVLPLKDQGGQVTGAVINF